MFATYHEIIDQFHQPRVLVIGDIFLDRYLKGDSNRLCAEAPVPVISIYDKTEFLGGAANIAVNFKSLGADVVFYP